MRSKHLSSSGPIYVVMLFGSRFQARMVLLAEMIAELCATVCSKADMRDQQMCSVDHATCGRHVAVIPEVFLLYVAEGAGGADQGCGAERQAGLPQQPLELDHKLPRRRRRQPLRHRHPQQQLRTR